MKTSHYANYCKETFESKARYKSDWSQVAVMSGPTMVIETIVRNVSDAKKVEMDWSFQGGRAFVMADTRDEKMVKELGEELRYSIPEIYIPQMD